MAQPQMTPEELFKFWGLDPTGLSVDPVAGLGTFSGAEGQGYSNGPTESYNVYQTGKNNPGDKYKQYGIDGSLQGEHEFHSGFDPRLLAGFLAAAGGMAAFLPGAAGTGAASGAGAAGELGGAAGSGTVNTSSFLPQFSNASVLAPTEYLPLLELPTGSGLAGLAPLAPIGGGAGGLSSLLGGGGGASSAIGAGSSLLGPAAAAVGALSGAQGQEGPSQQSKIDPRMDSALYGEGGLFGRIPSLLDGQMANGGLGQLQRDVLSQAGGLLPNIQASYQGISGPQGRIAPNPFQRGQQ